MSLNLSPVNTPQRGVYSRLYSLSPNNHSLHLRAQHRLLIPVPRPSSSCHRERTFRASVAASEPSPVEETPTVEEPPPVEETPIVEEAQEWIALVSNAEFMLNDVQNESLAEQLREKIRLYQEKEREVDFFLVPEPEWLDEKFPDKAKRVGRPCVAIVSTDPVWMRFMKTRLDQVLEINLGLVKKSEALKSAGELPEFTKPTIWRAPYAAYSPGWWKAFYPPKN